MSGRSARPRKTTAHHTPQRASDASSVVASDMPQDDAALLQILLDWFPDNIYFKDRQSRFVRLNRSAAKTLGLNDPADALGRTDADFYPPHMAAAFRRDEERLIQTGRAMVGKIERADVAGGDPLWFSTTKAPILDAQGEVVGIVGISRDITAIHSELIESEQHYRMLVEQQNDLVCRLLPDATLTFVNEAYCRYFNKSQSELNGASCLSLIPEEHREWLGHEFELLGKDRPEFTHEHQVICTDGERRWVQWRNRATFDECGEVVDIHAVGRDVTDRHDAMDALARSEERFRSMFESAPIGIVLSELDGRIVQTNRAFQEMLGYEAAELRGRTYLELTDPEYHSADARYRAALREKGRYDPYRKQLIRKGGQRVDVELCGNLATGPDGVTRIWTFAEDITDTVRAEEENARLQRELLQIQRLESLGTLASGVAHEFNNFLMAIRAGVDLARERVPRDHEVRPLLEMIEDASAQAGEVTRSLLTFARRSESRKSPLDFAGLLRDLSPLMRRMLPNSITLVENIPAHGEIRVNGNPTELQQLLLNLVINARDAMPDGGRLTITMRDTPVGDPEPDARIELIVEDTGRGMDAEVRDRLFEPFFTTKSRITSTGLGLSIVHGIVTDHGGEIDVDSKPGRGARFTVRLPSTPAAAGQPLPPPATRPSATTRRGVILIAGIDRLTQEIIRSALREAGYTAVTIYDLESAAGAVRDQAPNASAAIVDVGHVGRGAAALLDDLCRARSDLPMLMLAAAGDEPPPVPAGRPIRTMKKPFGVDELVTALDALLADADHCGEDQHERSPEDPPRRRSRTPSRDAGASPVGRE